MTQVNEEQEHVHSEEELQLLLETIANNENRITVLEMRHKELRAQVIPEEVQKELDAVDAEFLDNIANAREKHTELITQIKQYIIKYGASVKSPSYTASLNKGRTSVDTKALKGYAVGNPEVNAFFKTGKPSVTLRRRNK